jgi:hypothetical protein
MDAYDIAGKIQKYWAALYPKASGELPKPKQIIKVLVNTEYGMREVVGVSIVDNHIQLELDKE